MTEPFSRQIPTLIRTAFALGPINIGAVAMYRFGLKTRAARVCRLKRRLPPCPYFRSSRTDWHGRPSARWQGSLHYFGWHKVPVAPNDFPDWHLNPFTGKRGAHCTRPWWRIPDFDPELGDIKTVWELSRFDWVLAMTQRALAGKEDEWGRLNRWLANWCRHNPAYLGPNWKCGQEASIRVMHLAMAALMAHQQEASSDHLLDLIEAHLARVAPTIRYAMAQNNNHGTSEAAALFIGGRWLARSGRPRTESLERLGRRWLENRVRRLIEEDGSFSQHSVNYHRLMLDTLSMAEVWRRRTGGQAFSGRWYERAAAAALWLHTMTDPTTGDAPNIGANDGARLLPLTDTGYRDFRPSVQLASVLFAGRRAYGGEGRWNEPLRWLGIGLPAGTIPPAGSRVFSSGGYAVLRRGTAAAVLRFPRFRFRPGHADALHLDLWRDGENLLRDGGSFSYTTGPEGAVDFAGTACHNTVEFDGRDQMPRLGRFLFGDWLQTDAWTPLTEDDRGACFGAGYRDRKGARHKRRVRLEGHRLIVRDEIRGGGRRAVLRWRLMPGPWTFMDRSTVSDGRHSLSVTADVGLRRCELASGWESRHYLQQTTLPVLEIEIASDGVVISEYRWRS